MHLLRLGCGRGSLGAGGGDANGHGDLGSERRREALLRHGGKPRWVAVLLSEEVEHLCAARSRLVRVQRAYSAFGPGGKLPGAVGAYSAQEAATRSPHAQCGGHGTYVSAQWSTAACTTSLPAISHRRRCT